MDIKQKLAALKATADSKNAISEKRSAVSSEYVVMSDKKKDETFIAFLDEQHIKYESYKSWETISYGCNKEDGTVSTRSVNVPSIRGQLKVFQDWAVRFQPYGSNKCTETFGILWKKWIVDIYAEVK